MQLIALRRVLPKRLRRQFVARWNDLLRWEQHRAECRFYKAFIDPGDLVFDIGAHRGGKTAAFLTLGARVVAVEPNPSCARAVGANNQHATVRGTLHVVCAAVAAQRGEMALTIFDSDSGMTSGSAEFLQHARTVGYGDARSVTARATTLDDLIREFGRPRFVKIDVEGMDADVLRGLSSKPDYLSYEYNTAASLIENVRECFRQAIRLGFTEANLTNAVAPNLMFKSWLHIDAARVKLEEWKSEGARWGDVIVR